MKQNILETIYQNIIDGFVTATVAGVHQAVAAGYSPEEILNQAMAAAMEEVGRRYESQTCFVPETLIAARAMKEGMAVLRPHLRQAGAPLIGKIVLGTVEGDIHDIGKNLVGMMFEGAGFQVIDLGVEVQAQQFVRAVEEHQANLVGLSTFLTTTMFHMPRTIRALQAAGLRDRVKVIVGGAPVTQQFADQIGADLYAADGATAAYRTRALLHG
jgi:5-methyltetrahydrofolate--homocysteine methyltransferase